MEDFEGAWQDINAKIEENKAEMLATLQELVRIKSVGEPAVGDLPFGKGVQEAFLYMLNKAEKDGFSVQNVDNYGGHVDFGGKVYNEEGELLEVATETMGILGHLDVVPEGSDWEHEPYGGELVDGKIYGRGTSDDKGPVIAAYYAMRALSDAGYIPEKKVRLILGLDEETNWKGIEYYLKKVPPVDFGFTPDADFPAICGEMGMLVFEIAKKINKSAAKGLVFRSMVGGKAPNMVPDEAKVLVRGDSYGELKEKLAEYKKETGYGLSAKGRGKSLEISAVGKAAHGAMPWKGLNAISILMDFLEKVGLVNEDICDFIDFYNRHLAFETDGSSLGCGLEDALSKLVLNVGMVSIDEEVARLVLNIRYPLTATDEEVFSGMKPILEKYNLGLVRLEQKPPLYMPQDDPIMATLLEIYQRHTQDFETKPLVIGGGTYAKAMPRTVAYGSLFPGEVDVMHQRDEFISLDSLMKATRIYAEAIYRLAGAKKQRLLTFARDED